MAPVKLASSNAPNTSFNIRNDKTSKTLLLIKLPWPWIALAQKLQVASTQFSCAHGSEKLAAALGAHYKYSGEQKSNWLLLRRCFTICWDNMDPTLLNSLYSKETLACCCFVLAGVGHRSLWPFIPGFKRDAVKNQNAVTLEPRHELISVLLLFKLPLRCKCSIPTLLLLLYASRISASWLTQA